MDSTVLTIPSKFGGQTRSAKPHMARCAACGDFGTITLEGCQRGSVMSEIMESEAPCTCQAGDLWRDLFAEWKRPVTLKGSKRPAAVVIDPEWKCKEPIAPQRIGAEAQRMLASIGGKR